MAKPVINPLIQNPIPTPRIPKVYTPTKYMPRADIPLATYPKLERRHPTSLADIVLGHPIKGTQQLQDLLLDNGHENLIEIPILNRVLGAYYYMNETRIEPIKQGRIGTAIINTLRGAGEDLDIFANITKSMFQNAGGGYREALARSVGWEEGAYREVFQFNTGNLMLDMLYETVADPMTWVSVGAGLAAKGSVSATQTASDAIINLAKTKYKVVVPEVMEPALKQVFKNADDLFQEAPDKVLNKILSALELRRTRLEHALKGTENLTTAQTSLRNQLNSLNKIANNLSQQDIADVILAMRFDKPYKYYKAAKTLKRIDRGFNKLAFAEAPVTSSTALLLKSDAFKAHIKPKVTSLINNIKYNMDDFDEVMYMEKPIEYKARILAYTKTRAHALKEISNKYNLNSDTLVNKYLAVAHKNVSNKVYDPALINQEFAVWLMKQIPEFADLTTKDVVSFLKLPDIEKLISEVAVVVSTYQIVSDATDTKYLNFLKSLMKVTNTSDLKNISFVNRLMKLYDTGFKSIKLNSLKDLNKFLASLPTEQRSSLEALLVYSGVTQDNAPDIFKLLQQRNKLLSFKDSTVFEETKNKIIARHAEVLNQDLAIAKAIYDENISEIMETIKGNRNKFINSSVPEHIRKEAFSYEEKYKKQLRSAIESKDKIIKKVLKEDTELKELTALKKEVEDFTPENLDKELTTRLKEIDSQLDELVYKAKADDYISELKDVEQNALSDFITHASTVDMLKFNPESNTFVDQIYKTIYEKTGTQLRILNTYSNYLSKIKAEFKSLKQKLIAQDIPNTLESLFNRYKETDFNLLVNAGIFETNDGEVLKEFLEFLNQNTLDSPQDLEDFKKLIDTLSDKSYKWINAIKNWNPIEQARQTYNAVSANAGNEIKRIQEDYRKQIADLTEVIEDNTVAANIRKESFIKRKELLDAYDNIEQIVQDNVEMYHRQIDVVTDEYVQIKDLISNLDDILNHAKGEKVNVEGIRKAIAANDAARVLVLSRAGNRVQVSREVFEISTNAEFFRALKNVNSKEHTTLIKIKDYLADLSTPESLIAAQQLNKVLMAFEGSAALDNVINSISKDAKLLDVLKYVKPEYQDLFKFLACEKLQKVYTDHPKIGPWQFKDKYLKTAIADYLDQIDRLSPEAIDYEGLARMLTLRSEFTGTVAENAVDYFKQAYTDAVVKAYTNFADTMINLHNKYNVPEASFLYYVDGDTLEALKELTHLTPGILKALVEKGDEQALEISDDIVSYLYKLCYTNTKEFKQNLTVALAELESNVVYKAQAEKLILQLQQVQVEAVNSLSNAINQGFKNIAFTNQALNNRTEILGKAVGTNGIYKIKNIHEFLTTSDVEKLVLDLGVYNNQYEWAVSQGLVTLQTVYDPAMAFKHNIEPIIKRGLDSKTYKELLDTLSDEDLQNYYKFYETYHRRFEQVSTYGIIKNKSELTDMINDLVALYTEEQGILFKLRGIVTPKQIKDYFENCTAKELYTWDGISRSRLYSKDLSEKYHEIISKHYEDLGNLEEIRDLTLEDYKLFDAEATGLFDEIEELDFRNKTDYLIDSNSFVRAVNMASVEDLATILATDTESLSGVLRDISTLKEHKGVVEKYVRSNLAAANNLQELSEKVKFSKTGKLLKQQRATVLKQNWKQWTPKQKKYFVDKAGGLVVVVDKSNNIRDIPGLTTIRLDEKTIAYVSTTVGDSEKIVWREFKEKTMLYPEQQFVTDAIKKNYRYYEFDEDFFIPANIYNGELISRTTLSNMLDSTYFDAVRKTVPDFKDRVLKLFEKKSQRPNFIIVGDADAYNHIVDACTDAFLATNTELPYKSTNLYKSVLGGGMTAIRNADNKIKYIAQFYHKDFAPDSPLFKPIFEGSTDKEIVSLFKRNDWDAIILKADRKGNPVVYKVHINGRKDLDLLAKQGGLVVPHEVYRNMYLTLAKDRISDNALLKVYNQIVTMTYKTMMLSSLGQLVRNGVDTLVYKNLATTDGYGSLVNNFKYEYKAAKMWDWYDKTYQRMLGVAKAHGRDLAGKEDIAAIFKTLSKEEQCTYILMHIFESSSGASSFIKSFEEALIAHNVDRIKADRSTLERIIASYQDIIAGAPGIKQVRTLTDNIEQTGRLALFLQLIDNGNNISEAIRKIVNTHFDYGFKTTPQEMLEHIFWFSTFPLNNYLYFINEGLTKNPELLRLHLDLTEQSYNSGDYTWDKAKRSRSLSYNMMAGNLRFYTNDGTNVYLKLGSSVFDFFSLVSNPIGEAKDRVNPFLSALFGFEDLSTLNPLFTPQYRLKQIQEGKSLLPSVYTQAPAYPDKHKVYYKYRPGYYRNKARWRSYPKRSTASSAVRRLAYNQAQGKYYFAKHARKYYRNIAVTNYRNLYIPLEPYYSYKPRIRGARQTVDAIKRIQVGNRPIRVTYK